MQLSVGERSATKPVILPEFNLMSEPLKGLLSLKLEYCVFVLQVYCPSGTQIWML